jgi:hypothetical protein
MHTNVYTNVSVAVPALPLHHIYNNARWQLPALQEQKAFEAVQK